MQNELQLRIAYNGVMRTLTTIYKMDCNDALLIYSRHLFFRLEMASFRM